MGDPQDLVSVYQATNVTEAHLVKNMLFDEGIESSVSEQNEPLAGLPIAQCDVLVRVADEQHALQIVASYEQSLIERRTTGLDLREMQGNRNRSIRRVRQLRRNAAGARRGRIIRDAT